MSNSVIVINDENFETEVLEAEEPVLAYFWATWCGPCRLTAPAVDSVATHYSDRLKVVKMEIDSNPNTVTEYKVHGVPAFMLFKNVVLVLSHEAGIHQTRLLSLLDPHL